MSAGAVHNAGMKDHYVTFAGYNAWANRRLYDAAALLSDAEYRADKGAFFKSMHGTLNHLLATDRIWMKRFTGEGEAPDRLDAIVHERLADLRAAREAEDRRIVAYIDSLDEARLAGVIRYRRVSTPEEFVQKLIARARPLVQPPDPSSRSRTYDPDQPGQDGSRARPSVLSARGRGRPRLNRSVAMRR